MKKTILALVLILLLLPMTFGCDQSSDIQENNTSSQTTVTTNPDGPENPTESIPLTFEEIMALPTVQSFDIDRPFIRDFDEYLQRMNQRGVPYSFVSGEAVESHRYLAWNGDMIYGFTLTTVRITAVDSDYNDLELAVGDTVTVKEGIYVFFADVDEGIAYVTEKICSANRADSLEAVENGACELVPVVGKKYIKYCDYNIGWHIPMEAGRPYTFCTVRNTDETGGFTDIYVALHVYGVGMTDPEGFLSKIGISVASDDLMIAEGINRRFISDEE